MKNVEWNNVIICMRRHTHIHTHTHTQYTEEERRRQENQRAKNLQALLQAEEEAIVTNDEEFECPICYTDVEPDEGVRLRGCLHLFCKSAITIT